MLSLPSPATLDYSPYQPAPSVTMVFEDAHLREVSDSQMERFWRVWYTERDFYAPALQTLILYLRPSLNSSSSAGISRFLAYFDSNVLYPYVRHNKTWGLCSPPSPTLQGPRAHYPIPPIGLQIYSLPTEDTPELVYSHVVGPL